MDYKNFLLIGLALLFTLSIFPIGMQALTYRADVNNGSWSQYTPNLASTYYQADTTQATYNRSFETPFSFSGDVTSCASNWCYVSTYTTGYALTDPTFSTKDINSAKTYSAGSQHVYLEGLTEITGDTNITFDYKVAASVGTGPNLSWGYINDSNLYYGLAKGSQTSFTTASYLIPQGKFKIAFDAVSETANQYAYIDNIIVTRNNVGTFFKDITPPYCSSISSCSNVDSNAGLTANAVSHLYWIVDYVPSATCAWTLNGVAQSNLTEMSGGMYYGLINDVIIPSAYKDFNLNASCTKPATTTKSFYASPRVYADDSALSTTITASNSLNSNVGVIGGTYSFYSDYKYGTTKLTGATCTLSVDGTPQTMTWNGTKYATTYTPLSQGTLTISHTCSQSGYADANTSYSVTIGADLSNAYTITPISNVSSSSVSNAPTTATINLTNNTSDVIFSVVTNAIAQPIIFSIKNSDTSSKQYFIYTSTDGATWVFDDTLTFGATNSTGVQKIWNGLNYTHSFTDTLTRYVPKYYKLVFQPVAKYWETIRSSADWINQNPPTYLDTNSKVYDVFSDSNYSNVQSFTTVPFQNLVSSDFNVGYELQFTAHATTAANLSVGYRPTNTTGGSDSVATVAITASAHRFSIPIAPNARDASLIIKSTNTASNTYYITDYAIVPRSYFVGQLEIKNPDYTGLQAILRNGTSSQYVLEGQNVRIQTSAYDTQGTLNKLEIQTLLGSVIVKDEFFPLISSGGQTWNFDQLIEGAIDLNGLGGELTTTSPFRTITYKAILYNTSNEAVSEQYKTVSILQYPYFPNDLRMQVEILNTKLGTNPSIRWSIQQRVAENFLGIDIAIYDSAHSVTSPNYYKRIYANELNCTSVKNCSKQITFDDYVWEGSTDNNFSVRVTALLSTEVKNYTDSYANNTQRAIVTPTGYLLIQMLQYMERHQVAYPPTPYHSTERIPLILGVIDDTGLNLGDTISPYFTIDVNGVSQTTQYSPDAFGYDETTGNNFWIFNQYLFMDNGNLLANDTNVKFKGYLVDKRSTQNSADNNFAFSDRCTTYPLDLLGSTTHWAQTAWNSTGGEIFNWKIKNNETGWVVNFIGSIANTIDQASAIKVFGCSAYPPLKVTQGGTGESLITIDNTYVLGTDNRQALYCGQKYDDNKAIDQLGDEFECVLFVHEDEEQIDGVHIQIGNENSDYSITNANKQYIDFTITSNDIMFTDLSALIRNWTLVGHSTKSPTLQDIAITFLHDTFAPHLSNDEIKANYKWAGMMGGDKNFNFYSDWNSQIFNKAIVFKISGLSVINARDYLTLEELGQANLKNFLSYARENNLNANPKKATITIYNNRSDSPYKVIETTAPFIINNLPSTPQQVMFSDGNIGITTVPAQLPFKVLSTMMSANSTKQDRLIANLVFQYLIKAHPQSQGGASLSDGAKWINDILYGVDSDGSPTGLFNAPIVFISNPLNIVIILIIIGFAFAFTLMARNVAPALQRR